MTWFLRSRRARDISLQTGFVGLLLLILVSAALVTRHNLASQGVSLSWDFLGYATGWTISFSLIDYTTSSTYGRALLVGLLNTVVLGLTSLLFATVIGGAVGTCRLSANKLLADLSLLYVRLFRNLPLILQALFWYALLTHLPRGREASRVLDVVFLTNRGIYGPSINSGSLGVLMAVVLAVLAIGFFAAAPLATTRRRAKVYLMTAMGAVLVSPAALVLDHDRTVPLFDLPHLQGLNFAGGARLAPELAAAVVAISLFGAAYIAEIVRAGLLAVGKGQLEAGSALGLRPSQVFWQIRLPIAIRIVLPTMINQYVWLMKATSIGIAIGFNDFFMVVANSINHAGQTLTLIAILVLGFWAINLTLSLVLNIVNRSIALDGQTHR